VFYAYIKQEATSTPCNPTAQEATIAAAIVRNANTASATTATLKHLNTEPQTKTKPTKNRKQKPKKNIFFINGIKKVLAD
jgi:hypothetical protein